MARLPRYLAFLVLVLIPCIANAASSSTFLLLQSQPGDTVGQGQTVAFTTASGPFTVQGNANAVTVSFHTSDNTQTWTLSFSAVTGAALGHSEYEGAIRVASSAQPGLLVTGNGHGCTTVTGRFMVNGITFASDGSIASLAVDFEQHCNGAAPALYGAIRYNSFVTAVPRLGVGAFTLLKGNAGTTDGPVILSLSLPSPDTVTVQYATANGAAVAGTDYVATSGTATFAPGVTTQVVNVPILGNRVARGNRAFKLLLSNATNAPISDATGNIRILDPNIAMSVLAMSSRPGDAIGQGQQYLFTIANGTITATRGTDNAVTVNVVNGDNWKAAFAAPNKTTLTPGNYPNAGNYPLQPAGSPGLNVSGAGRSCIAKGNFQALKASYNTDGSPKVFATNFEQHCGNAAAALFGWARYKSTLQQFSVTNAVVSGSNAVFTVTLNPSSPTSVSVKFITANGTAKNGTDYLKTQQTLIFSPGQVSQTVTVPLLSAPTGNKTFFGQLNTPTGAPVWISQGSATF